jgi:DNA-binding IscR family transcriptional regulator
VPLLPRKCILAVAAVTDIALTGHKGPVTSQALAKHHDLPSRHLEHVLQVLVREGILKGVRGPRGGYCSPASNTESRSRTFYVRL